MVTVPIFPVRKGPRLMLRLWVVLAIMTGAAISAAEAPDPGVSALAPQSRETIDPTDRTDLTDPTDLADSGDAAGPLLATLLDLETAQRRALADSPSLKAIEERVAQARMLVWQARSLYVPQVSASYSAAKAWLSDATLDSIEEQARLQATLTGQDPDDAVAAIEDNVKDYRFSLTAQYIVFNGLSREFSHMMAKYGRKEAEAGLQEAKRLLLSGVARAFHGVQLARESIRIAEADKAFNTRLLKEAKARRRVGAGSLSDILNFEVGQRAAETQLLFAQGDYDNARIVLAALMGLSEAHLPDEMRLAELHDERPDDMRLPSADEAIDYALEHRPDIRLNQYTVKRNKAAVMERYGAFYPTVGVFASRDAASEDKSDFAGEDYSSTVGVSVSYDLFTGGRRLARVFEAKHAKKQAEYELDDAELNLASEVRQALVNLGQAQQQLILQRATSEYVERDRELVEKEYRAGQGALARLNQAQRNLVAAQGRLALARVSLRSAWYTFRTATAETVAGLPEED